MIDIHTHILPDLDDGAEDFEEACVMAEMAVRSGVKAMAATPHSNDEYGFFNQESAYLREQFDTFRRMLREEKIPLEIYRGMEIWASTDIAEKIKSGRLLTLNGSRYVLVEFAFEEEAWWYDAVIQEIVKAGFIPVIAHPERYRCVQENPDLLFQWHQMGACAQMNKGSILGRFGRSAATCAEILLKHQLYTCIASDAHHQDYRTTDMFEVRRYMKKYYGTDYTEELLLENPLDMLRNREIHRKRRPLQIFERFR